MRISSPVHRKKARFEIIPLIDIMFFLLASFMMVSLTMIRVEAVKMDLPTPTAGQPGKKPEMVNLEVDERGDVFVEEGKERRPILAPVRVNLYAYLTNRLTAKTNVPAYIKGNPKATHGQVIRVLDTCRQAGIQKVSFNLSPQKK